MQTSRRETLARLLRFLRRFRADGKSNRAVGHANGNPGGDSTPPHSAIDAHGFPVR